MVLDPSGELVNLLRSAKRMDKWFEILIDTGEIAGEKTDGRFQHLYLYSLSDSLCREFRINKLTSFDEFFVDLSCYPSWISS